MATHIFDIAVNMGAKKSHLLLQRALVGCGQLVAVDGVLGKATFAAINQTHTYWLLDRFRLEVITHYLEIYHHNRCSLGLLPGWIGRITA